MSSQIQSIVEWWNSGENQNALDDLNKQQQRLSELQAQRQSFLEDSAGWSSLKFLSRRWQAITSQGKIRSEIKKTGQDIEAADTELQKITEGKADALASAGLEGHPDLAQRYEDITTRRMKLAFEADVLTQAEKPARDFMASINHTMDVVRGAMNMEVADMAINSPVMSVMSHGQTSGAKRAIGRLCDELEDFKEEMKDLPEKFPGINADSENMKNMSSTATMDLVFGIADLDILSTFTSWRNHGQLRKAQSGLYDLRDGVQSILDGAAEIRQGIDARAEAAEQEYAQFRQEVAQRLNMPPAFQARITSGA